MFQVICGRWWVLLLRGLAAIALGACAIVWPGITVWILMAVYGGFCLADGLSGLMLGFGGGKNGKVWWSMVFFGLLSIAAGIIAVAYPEITAFVLVTLIAISAIIRGVLEIASAIALRKEIDDEWVLVLSGVISIAFGVLLLAHPLAGTLALVLVIGAYMMVVGIMAVALSLRLRSLGKKRQAHAAA